MPAAARPIPPDLTAAAPLTDEDLDSVVLAIATAEPDHMTPAAAAFTVDNEGAAEWCMRHVARLAAVDADRRQQAKEWKAEVDAWLADVLGDTAQRRAFFEQHLVAYALERRAADERDKTVKLPSGKVSTTGHEPALAVMDGRDEELAQYLADVGFDSDDPEVPLVKWTAKVYQAPLRELVDRGLLEIVEVRHTEGEGDDAVTTVQRFACPVVDPATGEPWSDEVAIADRALPGTLVSDRTVTASVVPTKALR